MKGKATIRQSQGGWVVYFGNDVDNFVPFRSDEPVRFVKFVAEKIAGIKIDELLKAREIEMTENARKLDAGQPQ